MKKNSLKKVAVGIIAVMMIGATMGCGSGSNKAEAKDTTVKKVSVKKEPTDLTGTWKSENTDDSYQEATITADSIEINWVSDGGKTKSLYWAGSYEAPTEYVKEYKWTSNNDTTKTDAAMLASQDATKDFSYKNGTISYEASAMGTTTTVEMTKE